MTLPISQFFGRQDMSARERRPMLNEPVSVVAGGSRYSGSQSSYRVLWNKLKRSPELLATLGIIVTDVLGDRPEWTDINGDTLGRNKRLEAMRFWRNNQGKELMGAFLMDALLTGDGFIWKGKPTKEQIKKAVKEAIKRFAGQQDNLFVKELQQKAVESMDEDLHKTRKIDHLASSTVQILHDRYDVIGYEQQSHGERIIFKPNEVLHWRYMRVNGEVEGFAPAEALASEIYLLWLVKGNMIAFLQNGGTPDKAFILPKEIARSPNHKNLIETLRKFKSIENRHGQLVFTGELQIEDLQGNPKDLEYKDLALYVTSNIAFSYRIPVTRIPYLVGSAASKGDAGGLSESGYWNNISMIQDSLEDLMNGQLFEEMGWAIKFPRKYKQDEVREAQTASMNADTVTKYQTILQANGKQLKVEKVLSLLEMSDEDIEDWVASPMQEMENAMNNQNMLPNGQVMREPDKQQKASIKRNSANQRGSSTSATSTG